MAEQSKLQPLPTELLRHIGTYLADNDLAHFARTNRYFNQLFSPSLRIKSLDDKPTLVMVPALIWAIHRGHEDLVHRILFRPGFSMRFPDTSNAMLEAAKLGNGAIISMLFDAGYELTRLAMNEEPPLHACARNGHAAATQVLLNHGADITAKNLNGKTAFQVTVQSTRIIIQDRLFYPRTQPEKQQLYHAVDTQVVATLQVLINGGARPEILKADENGDTALHQAVVACIDFEAGPNFMGAGCGVLKLLMSYGADPLAENQDHETPVEEAVRYVTGTRTAVKFFLDNGISPNLICPGGWSLLAAAVMCEPESFDIVELLLTRGAIPDITLRLCGFFNDIEDPVPGLIEKFLVLLLIHGAEFGGDESACITFATYHGELDVIKLILDHHEDADINTAVQIRGQRYRLTPLQIAIKTARIDILEFLIEQGVRISAAQQVQVDRVMGTNPPYYDEFFPN